MNRNNDTQNIKIVEQNRINNYIAGLLSEASKKTCTAMAEKIGKSHDILQRVLSNPKRYIDFLNSNLIKMVREYSKEGETGYLIIDDTCLPKIFAQSIEGLSYAYYNILNKIIKSHTLVVVCWSNGMVTIPLRFKIWVSKKACNPDIYKKKTILAQSLIQELQNLITFQHVLLDGLYCSQEIMDFCDNLAIRFTIRFPRNRLVSTHPEGKKIQLRKHPAFKLKRNQRLKTFGVYVKGTKRYITAEKRKTKDGDYETVYMISNYKHKPKKIVATYFIRWNIEKFFRTAKQNLGIGHCQARILSRHKLHITAVFVAYAIIQKAKTNLKLSSPEKALRTLQKLKLISSFPLITAPGQCLEAYA